ncbi:flippase [Limnobacter profundi]|uniref:Flippase n=1 Tax=Limnobacter profundi TaxID=2732163 RepID=A0ABX6N8H3_9BURK|nr:flippase [Limnobacter sp. SAORIC-580]QJR30732.1 flippase [Limnobacter sp. SAORIC-580]
MVKSLPRLRTNVLALGSVQFLGYLIPLLTLPYVTRTIGVDAWGTVGLVQIIIGYFNLVTNWGFGMSGTRKIAAHRTDKNYRSRIFIAAWAAQLILGFVVVIVLILLIVFIPFFESYKNFYLLGIGIIVGNIMLPVWFLNGMECIKQSAIIQICSRVLSLPLIFIFVKSSSDAYLMIAIGAFTSLTSGVATIWWIFHNLDINWRYPTFKEIFIEIKEGATVFASSVWITLYTTLTPVVLGVVAGQASAGYYILADRFRQLAQSLLAPISQSLFPRMSSLFNDDTLKAKQLLLRSSKLILAISASSSFSLWIFSEFIVVTFAGEDFRPAVPVLQLLAPLPFIISLSNIFGIQILLPINKTKEFNGILAVAGALSLSMIIPLISLRNEQGAAINTLLVELFVTLSMAAYLWKIGFFCSISKVKRMA